MDFGSTLSRSLRIVLRNRAMWVLGFLAALGGIGGGGFNVPSFNNFPFGGTGSSSSTPSTPSPRLPSGPDGNLNDFFRNLDVRPEMFQAFIGVIIAACCVLALLSILLWVVGIIANGGLIAGAHHAEQEGATRFRTAWLAGAERMWRLIGMRLLLALPEIALTIIIVITFVVALSSAGGLAALSESKSEEALRLIFTALSGALCLIIPLICVAWVYTIIARGTTMFADRLIVLENLGAVESIKQGWGYFRRNAINTILMGVLLGVIEFVIGLITLFIAGIMFVPFIVAIVASAGQRDASLPIIFTLGGVAFLLLILISAVVNALFVAYRATVWTLAYKQFKHGTSDLPPAQGIQAV